MSNDSFNTEAQEVETTPVIQAIQSSQVELSTALQLQNAFNPIFERMQEWERVTRSIVVTDPTQLREMKQAREARLELRGLRTEADKKRKELKEDSLRYGKAVQGVYNVIEALIVPLEKYLEDQEKFAERIEKERQDKLREERTELLAPYVAFAPPCGDLGVIIDSEFERILNYAKREKIRIEAEERRKQEEEEAERVKQEEERKRLQAEAEDARKAQQEALEQARIAREAQERAEREKQEIQRKAQEEVKRIERERKQKEDDERKAKEAEEKKKQEEARKIANAPDVEKLMLFALTVDELKLPEVSGNEPKKICANVQTLLMKVSTYIRDNAKGL